jgi:hypothetical protein
MASSIGCTNVELAATAIRVMLGIIMLLAGSLKWAQGLEYTSLAKALGLRSRRLSKIGFQLLPAMEFLLGVWLLAGQWVTVALGMTLLLFASFTLVLGVLVRVGYKGSCACFGAVDRHQVGLVHLMRNIILMLGTAFALTQSFQSACVGGTVWRLPSSVLAIAVVLLAVAALVYILASEVETFFRYAGRQTLPSKSKGGKRV